MRALLFFVETNSALNTICIISQESSQSLTSRHLALRLRKKELKAEYWPRLTKEKVRNAFIKTDFSKWVDEDEQDGEKAALDDDFDMGGMGGMPGMGGMGGMPGMGGMGGMDLESVSFPHNPKLWT